ncbi:MAG: DUF2298 domain-containing protein, partial [Candidatus Levyibacteriota bacterium]
MLFLCSFWLFGKSFGYDTKTGSFLIASNIYLDFGAHIPFIRSFSLGNNFPGEVPFFANTGLLYYFLFDFFAGILERTGIRIDIAFNLLSVISFSFLLYMIYTIAYTLFKKKIVGYLSVLFFLLSSNLSFLTFFQKYGLHFSTISNWWHHNLYLEGQPIILSKILTPQIFWNLNTYLNQRHFVFGILFFLCIIYLLLQ